MNRRKLAYVGGIALCVMSSSATAQTLYSESFDSQASAKVIAVSEGQTIVTYADYSNFTIGATNHSIAEAPNQIAGSPETRGVVIQANITDGIASLVNLIAADAPGGNAVSFTGDFKLTCDMYLSLDPTANSGSAGTTEASLWGVGNDSVLPLSRGNRNNGSTSGTWGWLDEDNGLGTDAALYEATSLRGGVGDANNLALFQAAFPTGSPIAAAANNHWVELEVSVLAGEVTVKYNGVEFYTAASAATDGFAIIGYEDQFSSLSFSPDFQFGLFDNFVIERAVPSTLIARQTMGFAPLSEASATDTAEFTLTNNGAAAVTVSEINLTGADAANFSLAGGLPLVVPAAGAVVVEIVFTPGGERGTKSAQIEFVSDDAQSPSLSLPLNALFAPVLLAHYKLDETSGTTVIDSSSNGVNGGFQIRDPLLYGQTSLVGAGTSIGFAAANAPDSGSFALMRPLHVPTTSISMWINPSAEGGGDQTLFNRDPLYTAADAIYGCYLDPEGILIFRSGGEEALRSVDPVPNGQATHVVITHLDGDGFGNTSAVRSRMYINGVMVAENLFPTGFDDYPAGAATTSLFLATRTAAGTGYTGLMDDVQIYSTELNAFQVSAMYLAPGTIAVDPAQADIAFTSIVYDEEAGTVDLTWRSLPGRRYTSAESTDLITWFDIEDSILSGGTSSTTRVTGVPKGRRYFRVTLEPN